MAQFIIRLFIGILGHNSATPLIMTKDELANLLKVRKQDIDKAIKIRQLVAGRHYFLINDKVLFHVSGDLFCRILDDCHASAQIGEKIAAAAQAKAPVSNRAKNGDTSNQERNAA